MKIEIAMAICVACDEDPLSPGDARGNEYRWEDYLECVPAFLHQIKVRTNRDLLNE